MKDEVLQKAFTVYFFRLFIGFRYTLRFSCAGAGIWKD